MITIPSTTNLSGLAGTVAAKVRDSLAGKLLEAYALGLSDKQTAERLGLSVRTVQAYRTNHLQRLGVNNRQKSLRRAVCLGYRAPLRAGDIMSGV